MAYKFKLLGTIVSLLLMCVALPQRGWGDVITELHLQYGELEVPDFAGGGDENTLILTLDWAHDWKYGDNYCFADLSDSSRNNRFNDTDLFAECYANFSLGKISGRTIGIGPVKDVGIIAGFNLGIDDNFRKYLPGVRLSWDIPGFVFLNTDFMYFIDDNEGVHSGGAPKEDNGINIDVNWILPLQFKSQRFSIQGHIEYLSPLDNELGERSHGSVLGQPQFRWYVTEKVAIGVEFQFWINKLGRQKDEIAPQALFVWEF